ncbi:MAG: dihydroorotate dehydrogenase [Acidimicrobiia bacterium]|nr:dihydroorotate dehydrogenase [Acidimicrobiia bacterium]
MAGLLSRRRPHVDLRARVGSVELACPVLTAAGTAGYGAELGAFLDLSRLGAVVVKSLAAEPWAGNPAPRLLGTTGGMLNSVGLQGPGVAVWLAEHLPALEEAGATVVASIWGRTVEEFRRAAELLAASPRCVVAVEVNVSCPNLEDRDQIFAHAPSSTAAVVAATAGCGRPRWAKLSPNTDRLVDVAAAARDAGAEAVTLVNTLVGMAIDVDSRRPVLGAGGGGLSGPALHPVAVRAVHDVHAAHPALPIVGVGGVADATTAVELLLAGASAVQVGTATFADPRAPARVAAGLERWCRRHGVEGLDELVGAVHRLSQVPSQVSPAISR